MSEIKNTDVQSTFMCGDALPAYQLNTIRFCGSAVASCISSTVFYPLELMARRLQVNKTVFYQASLSPLENAKNYTRVAMGGTFPATFPAFMSKIYAGFPIALVYKGAVRTLKYGGQPLIREMLTNDLGQVYTSVFGPEWSKIWIDGTTGVMIGVNEAVMLLPCDAIKIRKQINPGSIEPGIRGLLNCVRQEKLSLWRGTGVTALRNSIGCSSFFVTHAAAKGYMQRDEQGRYSTTQQISASILATAVSMLLSAPADRVKSMIVSKLAPEGLTARQVALNMWRQEGLFSFWRGIGFKLPTAGPHTVCAYTLAQALIGAFEDWAKSVPSSSSLSGKTDEPSPRPNR